MQGNAIKPGEPTTDKPINSLHESYIAYKAVGGLITDDGGGVTKMTVEVFATKLGVDPATLWRWQKSIPDFWKRVEEKRNEIFSTNRVTAVWNGVYLRAMRGDAEQAKIFLGTYANWQPPAQKHEVEVTTGLADLVAKKKLLLEKKVIDAAPTSSSTPANS